MKIRKPILIKQKLKGKRRKEKWQIKGSRLTKRGTRKTYSRSKRRGASWYGYGLGR